MCFPGRATSTKNGPRRAIFTEPSLPESAEYGEKAGRRPAKNRREEKVSSRPTNREFVPVCMPDFRLYGAAPYFPRYMISSSFGSAFRGRSSPRVKIPTSGAGLKVVFTIFQVSSTGVYSSVQFRVPT